MFPGYHPRLTYALIAACLAVAIYSKLGSSIHTLHPILITKYANAGLPELADGQLWRLVSPIFIHFGVLHLALNMFWFWQLGALIERARGETMHGLLIIVSAALSNLAEFHFSGPLFGGMSGIIFAQLGYLWAQGRFNPFFPVRLNPQLFRAVMIWFLICWSGILSLIGIHIANWAHTVGLVSGILAGFLAARSRSGFA